MRKNPVYSKSFVKNYLKMRSLAYALESYPVFQIQNVLNRKEKNTNLSKGQLLFLKASVENLFEKDAEAFTQGDYPISLLKPKRPVQHIKNYGDILLDSFFISYRKRKNRKESFSNKIKQELEKYPEYYQQNFHYQTDGYLSEDSANRYEHQVEILFKGTAQPMRRRLVSLVKKYIDKDAKSILELGCGVGSATEAMLRALADKEFYCLDLSEAYLKKAQMTLESHSNIHFIKGRAEALKFQDRQLDCVFSTYLHHELPEKIRKQSFLETHRVLKKGGLLAFADSNQLGDMKELDWAIQNFPDDFHEPYFENYIHQPIEEIIEKSGFKILEKDVSFLTKSIVAQKA